MTSLEQSPAPPARRPVTPLRVSVVLPSLAPAGMEAVAVVLAGALRARGHSMRFICTDALGPLADDAAAHGCTVELAASRNRGSTLWPRALRDALRSSRPDLVHIHNAPWLKACWAARLAGVPAIVHTFHGLPAHLPSRDKRLMRIGAGMTDAIAAVSAPLAEFARAEFRVPAARIRVIRNGIDVDRYDNPRSGALHRTLGLGADALLVGMVARFDPVKDHSTMLRAFKQVRTAVPAAHLVLIGDGELRGAIEQEVQTLALGARVHLMGVQRDIPALLADLDVVALSSRAEGLPMALLEAMAAGRSVVATSVGAIPELLEQGAGTLVPSGDPAALAEALTAQLADAGSRGGIGASARERVRVRYGLAAMTDAYEAMYRDVLPRR